MRRVLAGALLAVSVGGCGLVGSTSPRRQSTSRSPRVAAVAGATARAPAAVRSPAPDAAAQRTHEIPTPAPAPHVSGGWRTPAAAVRTFATVYVNWTATTVSGRLLALARASVGQARAELTTQAAEVGRDHELRAGGIANAGTVEAVAPVAGRAAQYAVVTRERTVAARDDAYRGLAPEWHVSVATVTRLRDGLWVLSGWQPEN